MVVPFFWAPLTTPLLFGMIAIGTLGTVGHFLLIRAFQIVPAATLSPFMYVYLVWATALGWLIFGDVPGPATLLGAAIILGSGLYVYRQRGPEPGAPLL
jgi:drug/metabolite transporter (DMT)-like permease